MSVERYLEEGRRFGAGKAASYLGLKPQQMNAGVQLGITAAYAVLLTGLRGREETPLTALDNLEIKLPFIRSSLLQQTWETMPDADGDACMNAALATAYRCLVGAGQTVAIDPHYVTESAGYAGMISGIRTVTSGGMIWNSANPIQAAMLLCKQQGGTMHPAVCARNGSKFYLFDGDYGVFVAPDEAFSTFIRTYHQVQKIRKAVIGGMMRI